MPTDPVQVRSAIRKANDVRTSRARLKRDLARGRANLAKVLLEPPPFLLRADIFTLLKCAPGVGEGRARRILRTVQVSENLPVEKVTERKRKLIVETIADQLPGVWRTWERAA